MMTIDETYYGINVNDRANRATWDAVITTVKAAARIASWDEPMDAARAAEDAAREAATDADERIKEAIERKLG